MRAGLASYPDISLPEICWIVDDGCGTATPATWRTRGRQSIKVCERSFLEVPFREEPKPEAHGLVRARGGVRDCIKRGGGHLTGSDIACCFRKSGCHSRNTLSRRLLSTAQRTCFRAFKTLAFRPPRRECRDAWRDASEISILRSHLANRNVPARSLVPVYRRAGSTERLQCGAEALRCRYLHSSAYRQGGRRRTGTALISIRPYRRLFLSSGGRLYGKALHELIEFRLGQSPAGAIQLLRTRLPLRRRRA